MPSVSKAQFRYMKAVEEGKIKKPGLSPEKAKEFTEGFDKQRFSLKEYIGKKK
jgi:hypothetical protein